MLVAVYGTLKQGYRNHEQHLRGKQPVYSLTVNLPFRMYACETYPMIVPSSGSHPIYIEVYEVDVPTLTKLDELESPYNYHRETIFITELDREVEIYVYSEPDPPTDFWLVASGEWNL